MGIKELNMTRTLAENPLRDSSRSERGAAPVVMVIFGASGDLTTRKLIPALFDLGCERRLPSQFAVVGLSRSPLSHEEFRDRLKTGVHSFARNEDAPTQVWDSFSKGIFYHSGDLKDPQTYVQLKELLAQVDKERGTAGRRLFYLSTSPNYFPIILEQLSQAGMLQDPETSKVIIEKPFGTDLETAQALNQKVLSVAKERQVYRIDHYLGKETVQNLLVFRFGNAIFEPLWNRNHLSHIQITVSETVGLEGRAGYYEEAGVLKDMVQNHLMQLLCLVCMEPPVAFDAKSVRDEKVKVLKALRLDGGVGGDLSRSVVRGQYAQGWAGSVQVPGYREEPQVIKDSTTPTYVALKFAIDNWRWKGVPIYLRTGKRLTKRVSEIALQFKDVPQQLFPDEAPSPNVLALRIQPDQGVSLRFEAKRPGPKIQMQPVNMDFRYGSAFGMETPEAYERLLLDCMVGDQTLFTRADEVEEAWRVVMPVLKGWQENKVPLTFYESGSWGPAEAHQLIKQDGFRWRRL